MHTNYNLKTKGVCLQVYACEGQLVIHSPNQKLAVDDFFWKNSYWPLMQLLITNAFKIRAPMKITIMLLTLPWTLLPWYTKVFNSTASLLVLVTLELFLKVKIDGKSFLSPMQYMTPDKRIAFIWFWMIGPFVTTSYLLIWGAVVTDYVGFIKLWIAAFVLVYYLYMARFFVIILLESWLLAAFDLSFLCYYMIPAILFLFGILEYQQWSESTVLLSVGVFKNLRKTAADFAHKVGDKFHPEGSVARVSAAEHTAQRLGGATVEAANSSESTTQFPVNAVVGTVVSMIAGAAFNENSRDFVTFPSTVARLEEEKREFLTNVARAVCQESEKTNTEVKKLREQVAQLQDDLQALAQKSEQEKAKQKFNQEHLPLGATLRVENQTSESPTIK